MVRATARAGLIGVLFACLGACNEAPLQQTAAADGGEIVSGISPEQANRVIAKVGERTITLGDFARALDRMERFDRLRYQSKERRRELLAEMINVELLAQEARRRGLDKAPETQDQLRSILRDAMIAESREGLPVPSAIAAEDVRAYYEANQDRFNEPERRRVGAIVLADRKEAEKVLKAALEVKTPAEWGDLFFKHSVNAPKTRGPNAPLELAGDLGVVGAPGDARGSNARVPEPVRAAVFTITNVGAVAPSLVEFEGKQYVVRMNGITAAHKRELAEADRSIRVLLIQEQMKQREEALEAELRKKFPVEIDDRALAGVKMPAVLEKWDGTSASPWAKPDPMAAPSGSAAAGAPPAGSAAAGSPDKSPKGPDGKR